MFEWFINKCKQVHARLWTHRAVYCGLAGSYGAICFGMDKEVVNMVLTALYTALAVQR